MRKIILREVSPDSSGSTSFPVFARFYSSERNLLSYNDGAVPFLISIPESYNNDRIDQLEKNLNSAERFSRGYIFDSFNVYRIDDYGSQALSFSFDDFSPMCYHSDAAHPNYGRKIPQKDVVLIRNHTQKNTYVLIPKSKFGENEQPGVNVILRQSRKLTGSQSRLEVSRSGDVFPFNISQSGIESIEEATIFAREGSQYIEVPNSSAFTSLERPAFPEVEDVNTFVSKQGEYFKKIQAREPQQKGSLSTVAVLDTGLDSQSLYVSSRQYGRDYYYAQLSQINSSQQFIEDISARGISDAYYELSGQMTKLIQGRDYYIDPSGSFVAPTIPAASFVEVHVSKDRSERLFSSFETGQDFSPGSFSLRAALYHAYIADWDVNLDTSCASIFEDGRLIYCYDGKASYEQPEMKPSTSYEFIVESYSKSQPASSPPESDNQGVSYYYGTNSTRTSRALSKYQISTDPKLATDGSSLPDESFQTQEVFLYDESQGFKLDSDEPSAEIGYSGSIAASYTVKGLQDPYSSFSSELAELQSYQEGDEIMSILTDTEDPVNGARAAKVQAIESSIASLKRNLLAVLENSSVQYSAGSQSTQIPGGFLFLAVEGVEGSFDICYYNSQNTIVKKEYGCECSDSPIVSGSSRIYVSVPHFAFSYAKIERSPQFNYYAFK
jgi:hypothetical protein